MTSSQYLKDQLMPSWLAGATSVKIRNIKIPVKVSFSSELVEQSVKFSHQQCNQPRVNYLKTKWSISTTAKGSLLLCRIPSCPTHANKIHCLFKPPWAQMHAALSEQHPWAKLCGSYLALMEYPCTQHVPRTRKFVSFSTRLSSSLLLTLESIKSSNKVTEARLLWSLSHCGFLSCLQVYKQRFPFPVSAPQAHKDISSSMYIPTPRADGALESRSPSLDPKYSLPSSLYISSTPHFCLFHCFIFW